MGMMIAWALLQAQVPATTPTPPPPPPMHGGDVPMTCPVCEIIEASSTRRARPKSISFTVPALLSMMLAGLMSRCTIPCAWAAASPRAV